MVLTVGLRDVGGASSRYPLWAYRASETRMRASKSLGLGGVDAAASLFGQLLEASQAERVRG